MSTRSQLVKAGAGLQWETSAYLLRFSAPEVGGGVHDGSTRHTRIPDCIAHLAASTASISSIWTLPIESESLRPPHFWNRWDCSPDQVLQKSGHQSRILRKGSVEQHRFRSSSSRFVTPEGCGGPEALSRTNNGNTPSSDDVDRRDRNRCTGSPPALRGTLLWDPKLGSGRRRRAHHLGLRRLRDLRNS